MHVELGAALVGRADECAAIARLLAAAVEGDSGVLVIRGEAGIGKSALLGFAADRATGMTVLRAGGIEAEADLAFAGLYGLLRPILDELDELPEMQSAALRGALGLAPSAGADRLLVSAAVLGLLAAAAEGHPVLCLVDDAQWLDRPSSDAILFAARRLRADRIAIILGAREGEVSKFEAPDLAELRLTPLDEASSAALLETRADGLAASVRERLLAEARGNPLALVELPNALSAGQRVGQEPLPQAIPITPRIQACFRQRIERLPDSTRLALLVAAADDTGDLPSILRAAAELELPSDALDAAESAGLIRTSRGTVAFRHPLVRSAVYEAETLSRRQRAHGALAAALFGDEHADRRVWHQAMATLTVDEEVAAALEASARRSQARSAHASAATAFVRAAELSTGAGSRTRRLADAAEAAWHGGQPDAAREAIAAALPGAEGELKARLLYLRGLIEAYAGNVRDAPEALLEAAGITEDSSFRLEVLQEAGEASIYAGEFETALRISREQCAISPKSERDRFMVGIGTGWVAAFEGDYRAADAAFRDALRRVDALEDPRALIWASDSAAAGHLGSGLPYANRAVQVAREQGSLSLLPMALHRQASELYANSRFDVAYAAAVEGYRLAVDVGYGTGMHLGVMGAIEALWGRSEDAAEHASQALAIGRQSGSSLLADSAASTFGFIELTAGRPDAATDRLAALVSLDRPRAHLVLALHAIPDLVEAAVRAGRPDETLEPVSRYRTWANLSSTACGDALLARCEALIAQRPPDAAFEEALADETALPPFQRARTELLYGEWLRRERRRQDARVHLRAALELFRGLGTVPWAGRAEAELRATGETARKREPSTRDELTPQELQIAGLVAEGLTNKEIAAQLYLSPRTIDYHLRKVFSKLGISSRTELVRHVVAQRTPV